MTLTLPGMQSAPADEPRDERGDLADIDPDTIVPGIPPMVEATLPPHVLYLLLSGEPAVVVPSPPGGGKSTTAVIITANAHHYTSADGSEPLRIGIACQRTGQAEDLARKFGAIARDVPVYLSLGSKTKTPDNLPESVRAGKSLNGNEPGEVVIATSAKWQHSRHRPEIDLFIVDEAWQLTWATFSTIAGVADQYLLVGDPGQIAPVVTADTSRWEMRKVGPQIPAPDALLAKRPDDVQVCRLPHTRRVGNDIAFVISPLYPFEFGSIRPDRVLVGPDGIELTEVQSASVPGNGSVDDPALMNAVAARVEWLLHNAKYRDENGDVRALSGEDIAVVCARNVQVAAAMARVSHLDGVTVGTNDSLQGGEWVATVMLSPLAGVRDIRGFEADLGRMCVGLSRHVAHVTFIERDDTREALDMASSDNIGDNVKDVLVEVLGRFDEVATPAALADSAAS